MTSDSLPPTDRIRTVPFTSVLMCVELDDHSGRALTVAASLARAAQVGLVLVASTADEHDVAELEQRLDELAEQVLRVSVSCEVVFHADPATALAVAIVERAPTLPCVATPSPDSVGAALAEVILQRSGEPVVVVGPAAVPRSEMAEGAIVLCDNGAGAGDPPTDLVETWAAALDMHVGAVDAADLLDQGSGRAAALADGDAALVATSWRRGDTTSDRIVAVSPLPVLLIPVPDQPDPARAMTATGVVAGEVVVTTIRVETRVARGAAG
jgi:hypothetical protein